ncbi:MAG: prefoldin subunit beta [DPANN group archaeon]|nr:prefoldin subunit beta [DPANN group archaeon]
MAREMSSKAQEKLGELQLLQQRLTLFGAQKQQFQVQLAEVDNAINELGKTKSTAYKMVGEILLERPADELKKELDDKKVELDIRVKTLEKQETKTKDSALALQKELQAELK